MFGMSGCHDTTLAALLSSLGAFEGESWPPYTSHVAVELFKAEDREKVGGGQLDVAATATTAGEQQQTEPKRSSGMMAKLFGSGGGKAQIATEEGISRRPVTELSPSEKQKLDGFFVRVRYNDRPITVPGCRPPGKHWQGDESFCTLVCSHPLSKGPPKRWLYHCLVIPPLALDVTEFHLQTHHPQPRFCGSSFGGS